MGANLKTCAREIGFFRELDLQEIAAATPLHHAKGISAGLVLWYPELSVLLSAKAGPEQRQEELVAMDDGPGCRREDAASSSKVMAYNPWNAEVAWTVSSDIEEVLCMACLPERRVLVCGGSGVKELAAFDEQQQLLWTLDSNIGTPLALAWAPNQELLLFAGKQETAALAYGDILAHGRKCQPRWCANTGLLTTHCLVSAGGRAFVGGSFERVITGKVLALDVDNDGAELWEALPTVGAVLCMVFVETLGLLFAGGNHARVAALEAAGGAQRWILDPGVGESRQFGTFRYPGVTCLAWTSRSCQLLAGGGAGRVAALDPESGSVIWNVDPEVSALRSLACVPEQGMTVCCGSSGLAALVT